MDNLNKLQRSIAMSRVKSSNTSLEIIFRKEIWKRGFRGYRTNSKIIGKPDLFFPKKKVAIFIDGCYWHGCEKCAKFPKTNEGYWLDKFHNNKIRDILVNGKLKEQRIKILRFWEHDLRIKPDKIFDKTTKLLVEP